MIHLLKTLQWRHDRRDGVSNHRRLDCLLNRLFRCRSKKTSKLRVTGLYAGKTPVTGEFPAQMASNAENVCFRWRHHDVVLKLNMEHGTANGSPGDNFDEEYLRSSQWQSPSLVGNACVMGIFESWTCPVLTYNWYVAPRNPFFPGRYIF